jgi:hypothetical protein
MMYINSNVDLHQLQVFTRQLLLNKVLDMNNHKASFKGIMQSIMWFMFILLLFLLGILLLLANVA